MILIELNNCKKKQFSIPSIWLLLVADDSSFFTDCVLGQKDELVVISWRDRNGMLGCHLS